MKPSTLRVLSRIIAVLFAGVAVALCGLLVYEVIDIFGTLEQRWVGNRVSVAVASAMNEGAAYIGTAVKTVALILLAAGTDFFTARGMSEQDAQMATKGIGAVTFLCLDVWLIYYLVFKRRWVTLSLR